MEEQIKGYEEENDVIMISHGDCIGDARYVGEIGRRAVWDPQYFDQLRRNSYRLSYRDRSCSALFYGKQTIEKIERRDAEGAKIILSIRYPDFCMQTWRPAGFPHQRYLPVR